MSASTVRAITATLEPPPPRAAHRALSWRGHRYIQRAPCVSKARSTQPPSRAAPRALLNRSARAAARSGARVAHRAHRASCAPSTRSECEPPRRSAKVLASSLGMSCGADSGPAVGRQPEYWRHCCTAHRPDPQGDAPYGNNAFWASTMAQSAGGSPCAAALCATCSLWTATATH